MTWCPPRWLVAIVFVPFVLAACGGPVANPPSGPERTTLAGTVANLDDVPVPINLTLFAVSAVALENLEVAPAALPVYPPGLVAVGGALLGLDGAFSIPLATGEELPEDAFVDASELVQYPAFGPDIECVGTATAPAQVLPIVWAEVFAAPYVVAGPIAGPSGTSPLGVLFFGEGVPQTPPVENATATWTYATAATRATGTCSYQATVFVGWDVALEPGWNQVTVDGFQGYLGELSNRAMLNPRWRFWPAP